MTFPAWLNPEQAMRVHAQGWDGQGVEYKMYLTPAEAIAYDPILGGYAFKAAIQAGDNPARSLATLDPGQKLVDGSGMPLGFVPRTLYVRTFRDVSASGGSTAPFLGADGDPVIVATGTANLELNGLLESGAPFTKRFGLDQDRVVRFDVAGFLQVNVRVIHSSIIGYGISGVLTSREPTTGLGADVVFYAEQYNLAGLYRAPPGAIRMTPALGDAGFEWRQESASGVLVMPEAQVAGVQVTRKANKFLTTVTPFTATWEIAP